MADPRGNLALTYLAIADRYKPRWIVWENVPGVLSSNGGRDFGSFLGALAKLGYGFAYRVLDARFFGVAQRRRRVFVVGYLGDWRRAAAVLFESPSGSRDTASRREKRQSVAPTVVSGPPFSRTENARVEADALVPITDPAYCLETTCNDYSRADGFNMVAQPMMFKVRGGVEREDGSRGSTNVGKQAGKGFLGNTDRAFTVASTQDQWLAQPVAFTRCDDGGDAVVDGTPTMRCGSNYSAHLAVAQPVAFHIDAQPDQMNFSSETTASLTCSQHAGVMLPVAYQSSDGVVRECGNVMGTLDAAGESRGTNQQRFVMQPVAPSLTASNDPSRSPQSSEVTQQVAAVHSASMQVRRLTPTECERLQGFPDGYTNIKDNCPDGPRYKALGNSMAVPVMRWIGERIDKI